uniref:Putative secreted protein n=1 Tax=Xenopsylla cheopis TaxID=163159 RepID=A0A6M2E0L7_XENCH
MYYFTQNLKVTLKHWEGMPLLLVHLLVWQLRSLLALMFRPMFVVKMIIKITWLAPHQLAACGVLCAGLTSLQSTLH